jgi:hypothetical protein
MTLENYFYTSPSRVKRYQTIEISHSSFSHLYRVCRNCSLDGLQANIEDGTLASFDYYPMEIKRSGEQNNLDQSLTISFGDLGEILPQEIDRVVSADTSLEYPQIKYREFRSDDLTTVLAGPELYRIETIAFTKTQSTFDVVAPRLNLYGSGLIYNNNDLPMLNGFI